MKILKRIIFGLLAILILFFLGGYFYLQTLKPQLSGEIRLDGLISPVEVYFDDFGIPHIYASNEEDAYFAFGYVNAQDRLFQMEMLRRAASGRLAEVLGEDLLPVDKFFRTLGLNKFSQLHSQKYMAGDSAPYQKAVHAYIKGVNRYIEHGKTPLEFSIIGIPKTPFTAEDIYYAVGFMSLGFAEGFEADPVFQKIKNEYGASYLEDLAVHTPPDAEIIPVHNGPVKTKSHDKLISSLRETFEKLPVPLFQGSNGWVIAAEKSTSGFPILANDTHMGYSQPAVWYEAHLEYPGVSFYGHHLAGFPFGILGNNRFCGWGLTMFENDDVDFFQETLNPENTMQVRFKDRWEDLKIRNEIIRVKGQPDIVFEVKESRHGPIINGIVDHIESGDPISVSWVLLQQENHALEALYKLGRAVSFTEAEQAISMVSAPGLNFMYGDVDGNIAWWAAARLPVRPKHVETKLFLNGSSGDDEYLGYYDFSRNPKSVNPPDGFVYSANNQPDSVEGVLYPGYYYPKSRAGRIVTLLSENKKYSHEEMSVINMDHVSKMHAEIASTIAALLEESTHENKELASMVEILREWDGTHELESVAPSIYYSILSQVLVLTFRDELGDEALTTLLKTAVLKNSIHRLLKNERSPWWDDITSTDKKETRGEILSKSLANALEKLRETTGSTPTSWKWGKIHTLTHKHALSEVRILDKIFNVGPFPVGGGSEVINNLDFRYNTSGYFPVGSGPALRKVTDFSNIEQGVTISPTGQSGNIMSRHYSDQAEMFIAGKSRPMLMNREQIEQECINKLMLIPQ